MERWERVRVSECSRIEACVQLAMKCYLTVLTCVWVIALGRLDFYEGDVCKQEKGVLWACKVMRDCPKAQGKRPSICEFKGEESIVCCEPEVKPPVSGSKSKQMCEKYAESVFIRLQDPVTGEYEKINKCAIVEPLITGGQNANSREYPHMALIGYEKNNAIEWLCGGSLISDQFVLSAGHCTYPGELVASWVRLGEFNLQSKKDEDSGLARSQDYEIMERINHPEYKNSSLYNDIALYKLKTRVEFNEYIRPICLQTEHQFAKTYAIATGWGRTQYGGNPSDYLQKINVTITQRKECSEAYKPAKGPTLKDGILDTSMLCAGDIKTGKEVCQGDSGGPLQVPLKQPYCMYSQVGITSFGDKCAGERSGVYTRVSHFVPWIESVVWP